MSEKSRITFASVNQAKLPFNLVLQGNEGTPAGTIKIDKELVTFEGNFDESAQVFIDHLARRWSQQWRERRNCSSDLPSPQISLMTPVAPFVATITRLPVVIALRLRS